MRCSIFTLFKTGKLENEVPSRSLFAYLKMDLKSDFFDFFQPICFWKAETKLEMNLLEFL